MLVKASLAFLVATLFVLAGCSSTSGASDDLIAVPGLKRAAKSDLVSKHIQHVVVIVQENRSFENFFAGYPGANAPLTGCGRRPADRLGRSVVSPASPSGCPKATSKSPYIK